MSVQEMGGAAIPEEAANTSNRERIVAFSSIAGTVSVTVFVATQAFAVALIIAWAVSGALGAGPRASLVFYAIAMACALVATVLIWRLAWEAETRPENNA